MEELPSHIMIDILSRLPVKTIIHCKCVCNRWRNLVSNSRFSDIHLSRSPAGLMIHHTYSKNMRSGIDRPGVLRWVEIKNELDHQRLHHDPVMSLDLGLAPVLRESTLLQVGSVNGLICLWQSGSDISDNCDDTYICNPITREYIILPRQIHYRNAHRTIVYGFGVGLRTNEYKVIRSSQLIQPNPHETPRLEAEVYTLGTGQWRSLGPVPYWLNGWHGPFLNGNVHWIVLDKDSIEKLCTFDIENETFQLFPSRPSDAKDESPMHFVSLAVMRGCLCQSDTYYDDEIVIWVMKEYGIKESWCKEVVIKKSVSPDLDWVMWEPLYLMEGLKDGSFLMVYYEDFLLKYCPERKTVEKVELFDRYFNGIAYRPSFVKLVRFESERVLVF
ncbi:hypothetical protein SSX86_006697 [Deinandra increscens subsp. villosa]|uniref:F-box domain-containing protein n=1 Tax=Deinandra increscens subsp. villosa TaxID=3103831 RepID=A0AAP0H8X1_9ASTR